MPKKWIDMECQALKEKSKQSANMKHHNPWDKSLLQQHREILKHYKKICAFKNYNFWKEEVIKLERSLSSSQEFWETWGKVGENRTNSLIPEVCGKRWETHFKTLFKEHKGKIEDILPKVQVDINEELNKPFSMTEFQTTLSKLKNNKVVGPDRIPNEFIKHVTYEIKEIILKFLNLNLKFGMTAEKLCQDFITVIHKEGKRNDPDNYRGFCIANSLLEILSSLLETRLKEFCKINNLIDKERIRFQENARTADHILTLKTIINKYVTD